MKINFIFKVVLFNENRKKLLFSKKIRALIKRIATEENRELSSVNIIFCDDKFIRDHNKRFLGHDYETDIITFHDTDEEGLTEGELLISADTVKSNSVKFKTKFDEELCRVITHGILHLSGYNDKTRSEKLKIRKKENYYIKKTDDARKGN